MKCEEFYYEHCAMWFGLFDMNVLESECIVDSVNVPSGV